MDILKTVGLILAVIFSFNVIIFVHELGHFLAARWRGLEVERFQIWFGKPIWKKTINGVQYGLGTIPAGGFVALPQMAPMESIEGSNEERSNPLPPITPLDKIIVAFAGPLFSFLLAVVAAVILWQVGKPKDKLDTTTIGYVDPSMPAAVAGLMPGDTVLAINGEAVTGFAGGLDCISEKIVFSEGDTIKLDVDRPNVGKVEIETGYHIEKAESFLQRDGHRQIGIGPQESVIVGQLEAGGPAEYSGFKLGDRIISVEGTKVESRAHFSSILRENRGKLLSVKVNRNDEIVTLKTAPIVPSNGYRLIPDKEPQPMIGMRYMASEKVTELLYPTPVEQIRDTSKIMFVTISALFSPKSSVGIGDLSGPVGIGKMKYHIFQSEYPLRKMLYFWVLFNVNLAIFNLLPFPVLDGGHITMAVSEAIRKKPLNTRFLEVIQTGFVIILFSVFLYVTMKDTFTKFGFSGPPHDPNNPEKPIWKKEDLEKAFNQV